ncbi:tRNA (guanine(37)-N1)-methyltransferase-like [Dendronephthya gigantea]|uniref:tRNA (guanine(37)-N1)-methyltransferase-like n=1 Tax=Dendronephthya gigantea TaxID=151771 RepID=UPI00106A0F8D|nr:tRNA (guanine(37)-N1)-methyltransferase-like [Dendronephthya gigantea]
MPLDLRPPESVREMKQLDHSAFQRKIGVPGLKVDAKHCSVLLKQLNKCLLNQPKLKNIVADPGGDLKKKIVLLNTEVLLNEEQEELLKSCNCERVRYELSLGYDYWSSDQILRAVLPVDIGEVTTAFESVGHIAHMNLRECQLSYKKLIGQVILDKNLPQIKTVVNKVNSIDETYRFFQMELLAGEDDMVATVKERGCSFTFDFSKVYWNSRLQNEHKRLVDIFQKDEVICDMFAGVGPFAIPAAKKGCVVYANDLNPKSFAALVKNCQVNRVEKYVHCFNMDAREILKHLLQKDRRLCFDHVIMNLPATAVEFLDVFRGLYRIVKPLEVGDETGTGVESTTKLPRVHCYCFSKAEDPVLDTKLQVSSRLGVVELEHCEVHNVRSVAPKKMMMCVSFRLPQEVAFDEHDCGGSARKRDQSEEGVTSDEFTKRAKVV